MHKVLIVEDELKVASFLQKGLGEYGFATFVAWDLATAQRLFAEQQPDVVLLDINLPDGNGISFCRTIRSQGNATPVLMLTARDSKTDKLEGFDAGADDYLPKPFEFEELLARIRSLLRRSLLSFSQHTLLTFEDITLNLLNHQVTKAGKPVELTVKEFNLLKLLMQNRGRVLDRDSIYSQLWDTNYETSSNTVDIYIHFLRKKIDTGPQKYIHTIKGLGYVLKKVD